MSILIKGMEMPKDCPMCPMAYWDEFNTFRGCDITKGKRHAVVNDKEYAESSTRPDWCPLVEVPEPHGRLIDADALEDSFEPSDFWNPEAVDNCFAAVRIVHSAHTIIPSSKEK